jgi:hypothetical protein
MHRSHRGFVRDGAVVRSRFVKRNPITWLLAALLLPFGAACAKPVPIEGKACPCSAEAGFVCCERGSDRGDICLPKGFVCQPLAPEGPGADGLPPAPPPQAFEGRQRLYQGEALENPHLLNFTKPGWVQFSVRQSPPALDSTQGGVVDIHVVNREDPSTHRLILAGASDRPEWAPFEDVSGARFFMTDERALPTGAVGTLQRVAIPDGVKETIPDVMRYTLGSAQVFTYVKHTPALPELHARELSGRDRNLGALSGRYSHLGTDAFYFISGADHTLTHVEGFDAPAVLIRAHVSEFQIIDNQRYAMIIDEGTLRPVIVDLTTKEEQALAVAVACCGYSATDTGVAFGEAAKPGQPARWHQYDRKTGVDEVWDMPSALVDVAAVQPWPGSPGTFLVRDTTGRQARYRRTSDSFAADMLPLQALDVQISRDGRYVLFMVLDNTAFPVGGVTTGQLYVQDSEHFSEPPTLLSPPGTHVPITPSPGYILLGEEGSRLVFFTRAGLGNDIYAGDYVTGFSRRIAERAGNVSFSATLLFGIVNLNDDVTGDLVVRDLIRGADLYREPQVAEFDVAQDALIYIVREPSLAPSRSGLWTAKVPSVARQSP